MAVSKVHYPGVKAIVNFLESHMGEKKFRQVVGQGLELSEAGEHPGDRAEHHPTKCQFCLLVRASHRASHPDSSWRSHPAFAHLSVEALRQIP